VSRLAAYGIGLSLAVATAWPGFGDPTDDSYPLSTYPMFARPRDKPWLDFVEAVDRSGAMTRVGPSLLGSDEVMQAVATVKRAVAAGPDGVGRLCASVAERIAHDPESHALVEVRVVGARFDPLAYFTTGPAPEQKVEHARCTVPGRP